MERKQMVDSPQQRNRLARWMSRLSLTHRRLPIGVVLGGLGLAIATTLGTAAVATSQDAGPTPESVIGSLSAPAPKAQPVSDEALDAAAEVDEELGIPDLSRMQVLDDRSEGLTVIFPVGETGICFLRQIQAGVETHIVRTCAPASQVASHGLPLRISIASDQGVVLFDETAVLVPDGYDSLMLGTQRIGTIRNNLVILPKVEGAGAPFLARGSVGVMELGVLSG